MPARDKLRVESSTTNSTIGSRKLDQPSLCGERLREHEQQTLTQVISRRLRLQEIGL